MARRTYDMAVTIAWRKHIKEMAPAETAYLEAHEKAKALTGKAHEEAMTSALNAYRKVVGPSWKTLKEDVAIAVRTYEGDKRRV